MRLAWILLCAAATAAHAQPPLRSYVEQRVVVTWFPADGERGPWPAIGSSVDAAALDCTATGEGGGQPIVCRTTGLAAELRASGSPFARCYKLHETKLPARSVHAYATTGWNKTATLLFVLDHTHRTEAVYGPCTATGIDACMGGGPRKLLGHKTVRESYREVVPATPELAADPFAKVHSTAIWIAPLDGAWPAAPTTSTYDATALTALAASSSPADVRFVVAIDLVTVRLVAADVAGARDALDRAAALATELTGTAFVAPSLTPATAADADAVAHDTAPAAARHAMLRAMLGAGVFGPPAMQHATELARDLRTTLEPSASASTIFIRGSDLRVYVPEVLGTMTRLVHERWTDPCAATP